MGQMSLLIYATILYLVLSFGFKILFIKSSLFSATERISLSMPFSSIKPIPVYLCISAERCSHIFFFDTSELQEHLHSTNFSVPVL